MVLQYCRHYHYPRCTTRRLPSCTIPLLCSEKDQRMI